MNPFDPLRPESLDDLVGPPERGPAYGNYGPACSYRQYHWEMPWVETPQPTIPPYEEPQPEPPPPPRYEDCLLTPELFARAMRELKG